MISFFESLKLKFANEIDSSEQQQRAYSSCLRFWPKPFHGKNSMTVFGSFAWSLEVNELFAKISGGCGDVMWARYSTLLTCHLHSTIDGSFFSFSVLGRNFSYVNFTTHRIFHAICQQLIFLEQFRALHRRDVLNNWREKVKTHLEVQDDCPN